MKVDRELVAHVARLAHLKFSDQETSFYQDQLAKILDYVTQLNQLPGLAAPDVRGESYERPDQVLSPVAPGVAAETAVAQAPEKSGTYFSVPRIIE